MKVKKGGVWMPWGYTGKILRVNLTQKKSWIENQDEGFYRKYMGGRGVALYYLLNLISDPHVDAYDPNNILVFATSVVTGAPFPGNSRFTVAAKSPLTGGYGESEAGGFWGPELKTAGFDAIVIEGASSSPIFLWIHDSQCEIRDAQKLWGRTTGETEDIIKEELGDSKIRIACIGPAGENLVRYASIHNNIKHVNGRTGMGAVMGAKKLKAIAVRGTQKINIYDENKVKEKARWFTQKFKDNPVNSNLFEFGTSGGLLGLNDLGILPTRNFQEGVFEGAKDICGQKMKETIGVGKEGCFACPVGCKKRVEVKTGSFLVDPKYGGPEYETIAAFGSNCGISDLKAIAKANELCNKYGLDTISTGNVIAFAMECYEKNLIDINDTGGIELKFGNANAMVKVIEDIAMRRNLGNLLAEGVKRASQHIGKEAEKFAVHVKGEEAAMHEPRGKLGVGLGYAVGPKGADHIEMEHDECFVSENSEFLRDIYPLGIFDPLEVTDISPKKVRLFTYLQQLWGIYMILDICIFVAAPGRTFKLNDIVELVKAVTGWETSLFELMKASERALAMTRVFNIRTGITSKDDSLPPRFFTPLKGGQYQGKIVPKEKFEYAIRSYYRMMGWDENGMPTPEKLAELDIDWVKERFWDQNIEERR